MPELYIGCSGFSYPHWRGSFYPKELSQRCWLGHYSSVFASVELNATFYRLPKASTFVTWRRGTPPGFAFALKGSRFVTHVKRLRGPEEPLARFFDAAGELEEKLRAVLWQFPPGFAADGERLAEFLGLLGRYPVRHVLEFRDESWLADEVVSLCRANNVALCMADWPDYLDEAPLTTDFVYIRRHGRGGDYATGYDHTALARDAGRIMGYLAEGRSVFIYFNNDALGHAPENARELKEMLDG
jgi:uncharacterized protein YecE (DUF72 family)